MQIVNHALKIVSRDIKCDKFQWLWTIIFMIYMSITFSFMINSFFKDHHEFFNPFVDFLMLLVSPMMGFFFSRRSFKYLSEDSYTQMLFYYRSIPVPTEVVILSRAFMGLSAFVLNGIVFFGVTYAIASDLRSYMDLAAYASFGISWIGIGILIHGLFIYFEFMSSGKAYFWFTILLMFIFGVIMLGLVFVGGFKISLFDYFVFASYKWKLLSPVMWGSLALGLTGYILMCRLTYKRMQLRDLS